MVMSSRFAQCSMTLPSASRNQWVCVAEVALPVGGEDLTHRAGVVVNHERPGLPGAGGGVDDDDVAVDRYLVYLPAHAGKGAAQPQTCRVERGRPAAAASQGLVAGLPVDGLGVDQRLEVG
jgi:hypothetical protein